MSDTTELAVRDRPDPPDLAAAKAELRHIVNTSFVPQSYRGKPLEALACVLAGRELGIGTMEALREIAMVNGRPALSAKLMAGLVRKAGHSIGGEMGPDRAVVTGTRADTGDTITVTWTIEMAQRAGLAGKDNWKAYPEAMLWARAVAQLCRALFPDVITAVAHTPDEMELSPSEQVAVAVGGRFSPPPDDGPPLEGEIVDPDSGSGGTAAGGPGGDAAAVSASEPVYDGAAASEHEQESFFQPPPGATGAYRDE